AGLTGHLRIGRMAKIGAQAGVIADVDAGTEVVGSPAQPRRAFFREVAMLRRMARGAGKGAAERNGGAQGSAEPAAWSSGAAASHSGGPDADERGTAKPRVV